MAVQFATGAEIGRYRLESHLGGGGFGSVWRAVALASGGAVHEGDTVALKILDAIDKSKP